MVRTITEFLTTSRPYKNQSEVCDIEGLYKSLKLADVILVSGTSYAAKIVKVLTLSPWSHVVLYVGDRSKSLSEEERSAWTSKHGEESLKHLVIDADPVQGVHLRPLKEWSGHILRHCRAEALTSEDAKKVIEHAASQLGSPYDTAHIFKLLFFFVQLPWQLLPGRLRRRITQFSLSESERICSRVLSDAFHSVGFPIRPHALEKSELGFLEKFKSFGQGIKRRSKSAYKLAAGGKYLEAVQRIGAKRYSLIELKASRYFTPADYDMSQFFLIIKDKKGLKINYKNSRVFYNLDSS